MTLHEKMNVYLADQQVMFIKLHNLHWYVTGRGFFVLHAKLEEIYDVTAKIIDEVAERMLIIGASPVGSLEGALRLTNVKELEDKPVASDRAVEILRTDVDWWISATQELIELADNEGDTGTVDMFSEFLGEYQKLRWMLNAYLA